MSIVSLSGTGIKSMNYYWERMDKYSITKKELVKVGVRENVAHIDESLIPKLKEANALFSNEGYEIIVKDGYRSKVLYELAFEKRSKYDSAENTKKTLCLKRMPHSTGLAVDINLVDLKTGKEVEMRRYEDWPDGIFVDYYRGKEDARSREYQRLQDLLVNTMLGLGFKLGKKKEFHHFELDSSRQ